MDDLNTGDRRRDFLCAYPRGGGAVVSGTERHARLSKHMYNLLRQLWVFITRENASLARLIMQMTYLFQQVPYNMSYN